MQKNIIYNEIPSPPAAEHFLKRPAVEILLKNAFKKPLTTVIAGAGYGKTQAVLSVLGATKYQSAWIQLSELDNHTARFWRRIASSFEPQNRILFERLTALGYPESITAFDQFLCLLAGKLTHEKPFILVFDDFHLIHNKSILNFIELFTRACLQNFSIVLISREKPDISLTGMLLKGLLTRITEDHLRFSIKEMDTYFHEQGVDLCASMSADIYSYTEGWIFAIYLVGLAVKKEDISSQNPIQAAKIDIFDLMEKEIFHTASNDLQNLLIKTSLLGNIPSDILKELTVDHPSLMQEMTQISPFIRYDSFSDSYYIHHLFKEFLLERKGRLSESDIKKMHLTAAKWHQKNGHKIEAINHYRKCGCYHEIFDNILSFTHHIAKETADLFIELILQAPDEVIRKRPVMQVVMANCMFNNNKITDSKQELLRIQKEYEALPETKENSAVLGEAYIMLALISILHLDYAFENLFQKADRCLPNGSTLIDHKFNIAEGLNVCSIKDPSPGELKRHQDALFHTAPYASRVMNGCGHGLEYLNAAESSLYMGDLKSAEKYAYEAIYRARQYQQYDIEYMANFVLVRIFTAKGNYTETSNLLDQMKNQLETIPVSGCTPLYDIIQGWFHVKIGKTNQVARWIKYEEETRKMLIPVVLGREYLVRSDVLLAEERYYELLAFTEQMDEIYEARGILFAVIQNNITKAIIHHYLGNHTESINMLNKAYELSHPNDLIMQYIEYGNKMRTLIYSAKQNKNCKIPKEWLDKIHTKSSTYAKQLSRIISAYNTAHSLENGNQPKLSKRESEVLAYLYHGMTRDEIAAACFLSVRTVSSVLKSIYNKLGAFNAADAVRIAKKTHLL